ncbi:putative molecular chaperone [Marinobacter nitratireducens]|uniref:tRNA threonylcarbamoyladenosine biosynthesis protein TsaB n=1 Tax=Marinobacter nitratireducens TaxID=1137280 RepID=A0A072N0K3_9GAMM|nr:tRNA (adenosine(37)-N6)-threonylcarbamoyltransferase complex dimerization subunit type 1 TsaB [Marinobacter nitratireducens]KEF31051.1 putative molecular chaperone [Marinobacter nitratireducens]
MKLLALDTSSGGCSAALLDDGEITERFEIAPRGHTRLLMPMVRELLAEKNLTPSELDALAFACGPGSFTGIRIATGVVQGLAWGLDIPVVPVSSLAAVAVGAIDQFGLAEGDAVAVAFDARMGEVYWGCFGCADGLPVLLGEEQVCPPSMVSLESCSGRWVGAGPGWQFRADMPGAVSNAVPDSIESLVPRASGVARLAIHAAESGATVSADKAQPVYIRDEVAWKKLPGR